MHSLRELYKIGNGPSSSHTIGPKRATLLFLKKNPSVDYVKVTLYGSLALTGKGHLTDYIIDKTLGDIKHDIEFNFFEYVKHPNTMIFEGYAKDKLIDKKTILSIGGGSIYVDGEALEEFEEIYPLKHIYEIKAYCKENNMTFKDYVYKYEPDIKSYLELIYNKMIDSVTRGLNASGTLHGSLRVVRKAKSIYDGIKDEKNKILKNKRTLTSYAYAVAEENAAGGEIVTAPTCGASGVLPACVKFAVDSNNYRHDEIIDALAVAGLFGNVIKFTASISGAEAGCQAEVGSACAMSAAFVATLHGQSMDSVEQAAEIALEHHLGLTCDPILGYVQIPCIERNAVAALRAYDAADLAQMINSMDSKISFDMVCKTMLETGRDLGESYRETSIGGLAKNYKE